MEKIKHIKLIVLVILISFFIGCSGDQQKLTPGTKNTGFTNHTNNNEKKVTSTFVKIQDVKTKDMNIINKNGILFIKDENKEYILSSRGLDYNAYISNDRKLIVVDVLRTNNLQTIEVFSKKDTSRFKRIKRRIKKEVWKDYLEDKIYEFKDIDNPELKFYEWVDADSFELTLSYEFNDILNEKIIRYDVYK